MRWVVVNLSSEIKWTKEFPQTRNNRNTEILETNNNSDFFKIMSDMVERESP